MGFFTELLRSLVGTAAVQTATCHTEAHQTMHESAQQASSSTQQATSFQEQPERVKVAPSPTTTVQPMLIKKPNDLGTLDLPLPNEVPWLDNPQKTRIALDILERGYWEMAHYWKKYYVERKPIEEIVSTQEQPFYDRFWERLRDSWKMLRHPFWKAYLAGHFPNPQAVKGNPALAREICILDVGDFKYRQTQSLIGDEVYTLGVLQTSLFNDHWQPANITDMDKWHFREILMRYGLEVPPSDKPEPIPFAELFIGAVFGVKVTPQKRLSNCDFIQGDEPLEDRIQRIQKEGLISRYLIDDCEDVMFYLHPEPDYHGVDWTLINVRRNMEVRKILAGGDYPKVRSAMVKGVDLDQLDKIPVQDLSLSQRAQQRIQKYFIGAGVVTVADLVRTYHDWLVYEDGLASIEIKEYLYQHGYVIRPEDMPMDERTHFAYLGLPTRIRMNLRYPGCVETVDDLVRCCSGDDPVFSLQYMQGIGKKSMEVIRARLVELGFLTDSQ